MTAHRELGRHPMEDAEIGICPAAGLPGLRPEAALAATCVTAAQVLGMWANLRANAQSCTGGWWPEWRVAGRRSKVTCRTR
jgi:hypothetical protein